MQHTGDPCTLVVTYLTPGMVAEVSGHCCNIAADTDAQQYTVDYNAAVCTICFARIVVAET